MAYFMSENVGRSCKWMNENLKGTRQSVSEYLMAQYTAAKSKIYNHMCSSKIIRQLQ